MSVLALRSLSKSFGGVHAVREVSFEIGKGEFLAMIGPNGAGKSTCFNMINGQIAPDSGEILCDGKNIAGLAPRDIWRLGVGRTFQVAATFASMTVRENIEVALLARARAHARLARPPAAAMRAATDALLEQVRMTRFADQGASTLAYGDAKRVELAIALANAPRLLLMDEPTAGMAPAERVALMRLARTLATTTGLAILFTEHDMDVVFGTADRILVLNRGALIAAGNATAIRANQAVRAVYLGSGATTGGH